MAGQPLDGAYNNYSKSGIDPSALPYGHNSTEGYHDTDYPFVPQYHQSPFAHNQAEVRILLIYCIVINYKCLRLDFTTKIINKFSIIVLPLTILTGSFYSVNCEPN